MKSSFETAAYVVIVAIAAAMTKETTNDAVDPSIKMMKWRGMTFFMDVNIGMEAFGDLQLAEKHD
uniref:Uncharacterized protein n=1 Tax=Vitis vinifera TaxID=29760 RepID=A5BG60_VITVI|nr:hypothetical protein VITISV_022169 [Vitis vinifera]